MPRRERYFLPDQPLHVIQRGSPRECGDRQAIVFAADDYARYRDWLHEATCRHFCAVHAYVLMTNHVHLLVTPTAAESVPRLMQSLGRRYIELNPVRAGMVAEPAGYAWSSYPANALGAADPLVRPYALYLALGAAAEARRQAYRRLFEEVLGEDVVADLRAATDGGWAIGNERFKEKIAARLRRRVTPLPPGRPPKPLDSSDQLNILPKNPLRPRLFHTCMKVHLVR